MPAFEIVTGGGERIDAAADFSDMWVAVRRGVVSGNNHGNPAPKRRGRLCNIAAWLELPSQGRCPCARPPPSRLLQRQRRPVLWARPVLNGLSRKSAVRIVVCEE